MRLAGLEHGERGWIRTSDPRLKRTDYEASTEQNQALNSSVDAHSGAFTRTYRRNWTPLWTAVLAVLIIVPSLAAAQAITSEFPDAPPVKPQAAQTATHNYTGTKWTRIAFTSSVTARIVDASYTCHRLSEGGVREVWSPVKTCRGIALFDLGIVAAGVGAQAVLHKLGWHRFESLAHWYSAGSSAAGFSYSLTQASGRPPQTNNGPLPSVPQPR